MSVIISWGRRTMRLGKLQTRWFSRISGKLGFFEGQDFYIVMAIARIGF